MKAGFPLLLVAAAVAQATGAWAQIRTDASLGRPAASLTGPNFLIPEALGKLAGRNLFHSFQTFNIGGGESATFTTSTPNLANVVSRVTGGTPSQINGALSLQAAGGGAPAFFFINPAGVAFGAGAAVDVPGAFHVSTAHYLKFADGVFSADPNAASTFSTSAPEAFGFLGGARAAVRVNDGAFIVTQPGQALSLVAGDVGVNSASVVGKIGGSGELRVVAVGADAVNVPLVGAVPEVHGSLTVAGGFIRSATQNGTDAGRLLVAAGDVTVSEAGEIASFTAAAGRAARVELQVAGKLAIASGAVVDSSTVAAGPAGTVQVRAGEIAIEGQGRSFTGITSGAYSTSTGRAGDIDVAASGDIAVRYGLISSFTYAGGDGGSVSVAGRNVLVDGTGRDDAVTGISTATFPRAGGRAGALQVTAREALRVVDGGVIDSSTSSAQDGGLVRVEAGSIVIDGGPQRGYAAISSNASTSSSGRGGGIEVRTPGELVLRNGGQIDSSTYSTGHAGSVKIEAGSMLVDGRSASTQPTAVYGVSAPSASGDAGSIDITVARELQVLGTGSIDSSVYTAGNGGSVQVRAGSIVIDGGGRASAGIRGTTKAPTGYRPGSLDVAATGEIAIRDGGVIDSSTQGELSAGAVSVRAGSLTIDGQNDQDRLTGIFSSASFASTGHGGAVDVQVAGKLSIYTRGEIDSTTYSSGNAGSVRVQAGEILIDDRGRTGFLTGIFSESTSGATGNAGSVDVTASGALTIVDGGLIDSNTFGSGNAGSVKVRAGSILLDGRDYAYAAISSVAAPESSGHAGSVDVAAVGDIHLTRGGRIETATYSAGNAGSVQVEAATVRLDGSRASINASAKAIAQGQPGSLRVKASERIELTDGSRLTIQNDATSPDPARVAPGLLEVQAPVIVVGKDAQITAGASVNAPASNIEVRFGERLTLDEGSITTSANDGNGGAIRVVGGQLITMRGAQITTSVQGLTGNGGNIDIQATALVLDSGFIQANTAAENASGGDVHIDVRALVPSGTTLFLGGQAAYAFDPGVFGFNVIQAAAPTGVSGVVQIASPVLDVAGSLTGLQVPALAVADLARSPCEPGGRSSLSLAGHGGFAPSARDFLGLDLSMATPSSTAKALPPYTVAASSRMVPRCAR